MIKECKKKFERSNYKTQAENVIQKEKQKQTIVGDIIYDSKITVNKLDLSKVMTNGK
jgi:hypothetical protein